MRTSQRVLLAALALVIALEHPLAAQSGPVQLTVSGGPGEVTVERGGSASTSFVVRNPADHPQRVEVEVTGLTIGDDGYQFAGEPAGGISVEASPSTFTLAAASAQDVIVSVVAAGDAEPGGAYAGILVRGVPDVAPGEGPVVGEIALPIFAIVPGDVDDNGRIASFAPEQPSFDDGPVTFVAEFANAGNVHYAVAGSVELRAGARSLGSIDVPGVNVLPGTTRSIPISWSGSAPPGEVHATLALSWGRDGQHRGQAETTVRILRSEQARPGGSSSWRTPLALVALLALLLALGLLGRSALLRAGRDGQR